MKRPISYPPEPEEIDLSTGEIMRSSDQENNGNNEEKAKSEPKSKSSRPNKYMSATIEEGKSNNPISSLTPEKRAHLFAHQQIAPDYDWRPIFLSALAETGSTVAAAAKAEISPNHARKERRNNEAFAELWKEAMEISIEEVEISMRNRAFSSDLLTMFYLKAHRPEMYRDKYETNKVNVNINVSVDDLKAIQNQMANFDQELLSRGSASLGDTVDGEYSVIQTEDDADG